MSVTYIGLIVMALGAIAKFLGVEMNISEQDVVVTTATISQIIGFLIAAWGRFRHGDVNIFGLRK